MESGAQFLAEHKEAVLFWTVLFEQIGLPIPAIPLLVAAGAMVGQGKMSLAAALLLPVAASLPADIFWFWLGRVRGWQVLGWLCRISLEPDSCVRKTENLFFLHGTRSLLVAKFVPGLSTVAPPMAGIFGMGLVKFLVYDVAGALIWAGLCVGLGHLFSDQLDRVVTGLADLGSRAVLLLLGALLVYVAYKFLQRRRFLRQLRMAKMSVDELKARLDAEEPLTVIDVRHARDVQADPDMIPGAIHMALEDIDGRYHEIPKDREIILYCACPNEVSSARTALKLKRNGIHQVRPLEGGIDAWRQRKYPLVRHPGSSHGRRESRAAIGAGS
ncbi:Sulfurtransferase [Nitrospira tepida]|uniref:Sulfurtransferase n=1 Tax=Nitrospira tepida TaxID=2973512 RepID=A0AA86T0Q6_9BACT|nr:rhodanese-like domain-containing protein [Nitrospira tepida]CAI4029779.1 Sulfurtransferase [Nitrospira tepida]